jgi:hypothetical protein|tara:strand:- start:143 stop:250 length:108 start_codon:yes stop_codon:yes gene_type:complete
MPWSMAAERNLSAPAAAADIEAALGTITPIDPVTG